MTRPRVLAILSILWLVTIATIAVEAAKEANRKLPSVEYPKFF